MEASASLPKPLIESRSCLSSLFSRSSGSTQGSPLVLHPKAVMHFIDSSYSPPIREPRTNVGLNLKKATNLAWQGNAFEANLDRSTNQRSCREWKSLCSTSKLPRWRIQVKFPISRSSLITFRCDHDGSLLKWRERWALVMCCNSISRNKRKQ